MGDIVMGDPVFLYAGAGALGLMFVFGVIGALLARSRGRGAIVWGLLCFLFSLLGIIVLMCLPKVRRHPVWAKPRAGLDRASPTEVNEKETPTGRPPSGNGELRRSGTPFASEPADQVVDAGETSLIAPRTTIPNVSSAEAPRSMFEATLLEPRTTVPEVAPAEAPRSAPTIPVPRQARLPSVPGGYPAFQVLARRETKIELLCPNCAYVFRRPNSLLGKLEKCPECRAVMRIPT